MHLYGENPELLILHNSWYWTTVLEQHSRGGLVAVDEGTE